MCNPGINPVRTDQQLAQEARYHLKLFTLCVGELNKRGYTVCQRAANGVSASFPESLEVKKEVWL